VVNQLFYGNNLDVLRSSTHDESVDLIYLDPPFNSNANYNVLFMTLSEPTQPMMKEAASAGFYELGNRKYQKLQIITIKEALQGAKPTPIDAPLTLLQNDGYGGNNHQRRLGFYYWVCGPCDAVRQDRAHRSGFQPI
jgi:16S rRNA G966 N2-methylase RsmD